MLCHGWEPQHNGQPRRRRARTLPDILFLRLHLKFRLCGVLFVLCVVCKATGLMLINSLDIINFIGSVSHRARAQGDAEL